MYLADLHIHSKYSRATSRDCDLPHLELWGRRKGLQLLGTGDFTHPAWRKEMEEQLLPTGDGTYLLRESLLLPDETAGNPPSPRFVVSGEISSIYKKNGKTRKVHNVILLPGLEEAKMLADKLEAIGNIHSDGRPILGLDSRDLLEITLETCPDAVFIPAHIWTPHFSLFGAFSGFETIEECFEDLTPYIHALETGLSSDPPMNRRVSALDRFTLVSNSDAHSPAKLGREANLLDAPLSYQGLKQAIESGDGFAGTVEFFPEEGKYHLDGHRSCGVCLTPEETVRYGGHCPVCGKKITIGVEHRVEELADRPLDGVGGKMKPFESLVPLPEVIGGSTSVSPTGKKAERLYFSLLRSIGPEFYILREAPLERIEAEAGICVAEGIRRLRQGRVRKEAGYDGQYGVISLLNAAEIEELNGQASLFGPASAAGGTTKQKNLPNRKSKAGTPAAENIPAPEQLNQEQEAAATAPDPVVAVIAGPGTGKTKTLTERIAWLLEQGGAKPSEITAVTFTNQAAAEMRRRLEERFGGKAALRGITVGTFHSICLKLLGSPVLISRSEALDAAADILREYELKASPGKFLQQVSSYKNGVSLPDGKTADAVSAYCSRLKGWGVLDFDDLLLAALERPAAHRLGFTHLLVDEFQDLNGLQYDLIRRWSKRGKSLFVIGDPDQSVYGFRGASGACFKRLREELPALRVIHLAENYRSTPQILSCAHPILPQSQTRQALKPNRPNGEAVRLVTADSDFSEGIFIAKEIGRMTGGIDMLESQNAAERAVYRSFSEIAVLCRTHRQADLIEKCLIHDGIPCIVTGRGDYLEEDEVRGTLAFFRSLADPRDLPSLRLSLRCLWSCPADLTERALELFRCSDELDPVALQEECRGLGALELWAEKIAAFLPLVQKEPPRKLLECWTEGKLLSSSMEKLLQTAVFHPTMKSMLENLLIGQEGDLKRASGKNYRSGAVELMTLHGSKGLEFPVVFLAGVKKGVIPLESARRPADPEEERRLFYVGVTRAREELILTGSPSLSPFLEGLPLKRQEAGRSKPTSKAEQLSLF